MLRTASRNSGTAAKPEAAEGSRRNPDSFQARRTQSNIAVTDAAMLDWVRRAWKESGLRLEPSAASGFAAVPLFLEAVRNTGAVLPPTAIHVVWTTGGSQLPDDQFAALLDSPS